MDITVKPNIMIHTIHCDESTATELNPIDLLDFFKTVLTDSNNQKFESLSINKVRHTNDTNEKMVSVTISFQMWKKEESGKGTKFEWISFRAKDFSCKNINWTEAKDLAAI